MAFFTSRKKIAAAAGIRTLSLGMGRFSKTMLLVLAVAVSAGVAEGSSLRRPDMSKRQGEVADKRVPVKTVEMKRNTALTDQRIPIKNWHSEFSPLGHRRSDIQVQETRQKQMIRPEVIEMRAVDHKLAGQNGRVAYIRNFDRVREPVLVPKYRDADVATVQQMSRPAPSNTRQEQPLTMRDINRFSFQRNHPDTGGPKVDQPASTD